MRVMDVEYTDTFSGEANYGWVRRALIAVPDDATDRVVVRTAKRAIDLTGVRARVTSMGDMLRIDPIGSCTVAFVSETEHGDHLASFVSGFLACAVWADLMTSDMDDHDTDGDPDDLTIGARRTLEGEAVAWFLDNHELLSETGETDYSRHGHDLWLTRNHHGAGFWDRGYPSDLSDRLRKAAHAMGEQTLIRLRGGRIGVL